MTNEQPEQWAVDVEYLAKLADWAAGQGFCQLEGLPDPDEWCYDKWNKLFPKSCGDDYSAQALADGLIMSIQRAFAEREAELVARDQRTMEDHGRMLWRDDVGGICASPDMCFEYGDAVRCSPCAIKQSAAAGVQVREPDRTYAPQECRLKRENAELVAENAKLREAGETLRREATMLCQNAQACAVNHYGEDFAVHGMPQWLADSQARIQSAAQALAQQDTAALKSREADR